MIIRGKHWKTIWFKDGQDSIGIINQTKLPHYLETEILKTRNDVYQAIKNMLVRGAPLIGVAGGYGLALGIKEDPSDSSIKECFGLLNSARPTAVNLNWALNRVYRKIQDVPLKERYETAIHEAKNIESEDIEMCSLIGEHGENIIKEKSGNNLNNMLRPEFERFAYL